jgi:hypothetical protein
MAAPAAIVLSVRLWMIAMTVARWREWCHYTKGVGNDRAGDTSDPAVFCPIARCKAAQKAQPRRHNAIELIAWLDRYRMDCGFDLGGYGRYAATRADPQGIGVKGRIALPMVPSSYSGSSGAPDVGL